MKLRELLTLERLWWPLLLAVVGGGLLIAAERVLLRWAGVAGTALGARWLFSAGFVVGALATLLIVWRLGRGWRTYCAVDDMRSSWGNVMEETAAKCSCGRVLSSAGQHDPTEALIYGPYERKLKPGTHLVAIRMRVRAVDGGVAPRGSVLADVARSRGDEPPERLMQHKVRTDLWQGFRDFDLRFNVAPEDKGAKWEWRVFVAQAGVVVEVDQIRLRWIGPPPSA